VQFLFGHLLSAYQTSGHVVKAVIVKAAPPTIIGHWKEQISAFSAHFPCGIAITARPFAGKTFDLFTT
jgi:hypothetical protein